jgi:hypothetical protein
VISVSDDDAHPIQITPAEMTIEFNEELHEYTDETGKRIPSVTQALGVLESYAGIPASVLAKASERGTKVHKAVELHLQGDLDELSLDPDIANYFYSYVRFERETGFSPTASEARVHSKKFGYAGTLDLAGPDPLGSKRIAFIDIKTSVQLMPTTGPQLAAYEKAFQEQTKNIRKNLRYGLLLKPDGTYLLQPYTDTTDFSVFLACLTVFNYKGLKK